MSDIARTAPLLLATLAIALLTVAGYHVWISRHAPPPLAVLDLAEIYRLKEAQFARAIEDPKAGDAERERAFDEAQRFATDLQALIARLPAECGCVVLNRAAVIGAESLPDLTPQAKKAIGL